MINNLVSITGSDGNIGSFISDRLLRLGYKINKIEYSKINYDTLNTLNSDKLDNIISKILLNSKFLIHCAWKNFNTLDFNIKILENSFDLKLIKSILRVSKKKKIRIIFISSEYANSHLEGKESDYGFLKLNAEKLLLSYQYVKILRMSTFLNKNSRIHKFIMNSLNNDSKVELDNKSYFKPISEPTLLSGILELLNEKKFNRGIYNLSDKEKITRYQLYKIYQSHYVRDNKIKVIKKSFGFKNSLLKNSQIFKNIKLISLKQIVNSLFIEEAECKVLYSDKNSNLINLINSKSIFEINLSSAKAKVKKGGHYHSNINEYFYIFQGSIKVLIDNKNSKINYIVNNGDFFIINKMQKHSFLILKDAKWMSFNVLSNIDFLK